MKELVFVLIGFVLGMVAMFYIVRSELGDDYKINRFKQLNKRIKESIIDNDINAKMDAKPTKEQKTGIFKKWKNKRKLKKAKL